MPEPTEWALTKGGILQPKEQPQEEPPRRFDGESPTLAWFLGLDSSAQDEIWAELREMLRWSGWMADGTGLHAQDLFKALRRAGADWEEYT